MSTAVDRMELCEAILALIEKRWGLAPLGTRDAAQADLSTHALNFAP